MLEPIIMILEEIAILCLSFTAIFTFISVVVWSFELIRTAWYAIFTRQTFTDTWRFYHNR